LWGSITLEDAYGTIALSGLAGTGGTAFAETDRATSFVSPSWARTQLPEESRRGMSRFYFNPDDFVDPTAPSIMPPDDAPLFVRLQESHLATGGYLIVDPAAPLNASEPIRGPILVIPPSLFWHTAHPALTLAGTAPTGTLCAVGEVPVIDDTMQAPPPMIIELPRPGRIVTIVNTGATPLLFSSGLGALMVEIAAGAEEVFEGSLREIVLAAAAGGVTFSINATIGLES
jgi:hypothetical protein